MYMYTSTDRHKRRHMHKKRRTHLLPLSPLSFCLCCGHLAQPSRRTTLVYFQQHDVRLTDCSLDFPSCDQRQQNGIGYERKSTGTGRHCRFSVWHRVQMRQTASRCHKFSDDSLTVFDANLYPYRYFTIGHVRE